MAESCVKTLRGLVTRPLRVDEMCIQSGESVESVHEKVRKDCHQLVHLYQLDISRGWTIGSSFYWNESSWDKQMFRSSKFSSPFLFRERDRKMERDTQRERERERERGRYGEWKKRSVWLSLRLLNQSIRIQVIVEGERLAPSSLLFPVRYPRRRSRMIQSGILDLK